MQAAADQAGISAGYQFKLESGFVRTPSPRVLHRLGSVLGLQYQELMRLAGYPLEVETPGAAASSAPVRRKDAGVAGATPGDTEAERAPTNRRIVLLLEEIRRDVAALRAGLLNP